MSSLLICKRPRLLVWRRRAHCVRLWGCFALGDWEEVWGAYCSCVTDMIRKSSRVIDGDPYVGIRGNRALSRLAEGDGQPWPRREREPLAVDCHRMMPCRVLQYSADKAAVRYDSCSKSREEPCLWTPDGGEKIASAGRRAPFRHPSILAYPPHCTPANSVDWRVRPQCPFWPYASSLRSRIAIRNCQPSKLISMRPNSSHDTS
jgi:hypothetical protein